MAEQTEPVIDLISRFVPAILRGLHALEFAARHLDPSSLAQLIDAVRQQDHGLATLLEQSRALEWPDRLAPARDCLEEAASQTAEGIAALLAAAAAPQPIVAAYRALRNYARAAEAIYPMAPHLKPVGRFFLEADRRDDAELNARLAAADHARDGVGAMHVNGPAGTRGAFSLYVPEYYDPARAWPLVVAMHGGSGNGSAFLWSWVREARSRGFIVIAPTATGSTWLMLEPETDGANIDQIVERVAADWNLDSARRLLTGMSDGGTFTYVLGLRSGCSFTHLAPIAATFHPLLMSMADGERVRGLPVHIVHGSQDWMFPPEMAAMARRSLADAGANVIYREIADLSHTYPRDENGRILDWFLENR